MRDNTFDDPIKFSLVPNLTKHARIYFYCALCFIAQNNNIKLITVNFYYTWHAKNFEGYWGLFKLFVFL